MTDEKRRKFLQEMGLGLAGVGGAGLILRSDARPTPSAPNAEEVGRVLLQMGPPPQENVAAQGALKKTASMLARLFFHSSTSPSGNLLGSNVMWPPCGRSLKSIRLAVTQGCVTCPHVGSSYPLT